MKSVIVFIIVYLVLSFILPLMFVSDVSGYRAPWFVGAMGESPGAAIIALITAALVGRKK